MIKKMFLVLMLSLVCLQISSAEARSRSASNFGLGVVIGEPTGVTGKYWEARSRAIDFGLAFAFDDYFLLYADYLFHFPGAFGKASQFAAQLTPYVGLGAMLVFSTRDVGRATGHYFSETDSTIGIGARIPLGVEWRPFDPPLGIFVEIVPGIGVIPGTYGFLDGGIGARYYF